MAKLHHYQVLAQWTGNLGPGTSKYNAYSRNHEISGAAKSAPILGSSDPAFRGDDKRYNPEELLLGALASCHMLWVLHLASDAGIVITEYSDHATAEMLENPDGSAQFSKVTLRPVMRITDSSRTADALALHARAHAVCAIARSVNFPVSHEPKVEAGTGY